jgi:hypothetical protein
MENSKEPPTQDQTESRSYWYHYFEEYIEVTRSPVKGQQLHPNAVTFFQFLTCFSEKLTNIPNNYTTSQSMHNLEAHVSTFSCKNWCLNDLACNIHNFYHCSESDQLHHQAVCAHHIFAIQPSYAGIMSNHPNHPLYNLPLWTLSFNGTAGVRHACISYAILFILRNSLVYGITFVKHHCTDSLLFKQWIIYVDTVA